MNCTKCDSNNCIKKGLQKNKQRYYCKDCKHYFQLEYVYKAYAIETNKSIVSLLKEGCGIRNITRILSISDSVQKSVSIKTKIHNK